MSSMTTRPDSALVYDLEQKLLESLHTEVLGPLQVELVVGKNKLLEIPFSTRRSHMGMRLASVQLGIMVFCMSPSTLTGKTRYPVKE